MEITTQKFLEEKSSNRLFLIYAIQTIPFLTYGIMVLYFTINVPQHDEYPQMLKSLWPLISEIGILQKLEFIWELFYEYRYVFLRLSIWISYIVSGEINFSHFILIGAGIYFISVLIMRRHFLLNVNAHWLAFLTFTIFLLNPQYYDLTFMSMISYTNALCLLFIILMCWMLKKGTLLGLIYGSVFVICATFSYGHGIFGLVVGLVFLIRLRKTKLILVWCLVMAVVLTMYFWGYTHARTFSDLWLNIGPILIFYLRLNGAEFAYQPLDLIFGSISLLACIFLLIRYFFKIPPFLLGIIVFIQLTLLAIAMNRYFMPDYYPLMPRYKIYSFLSVGLSYLIATLLFAKLRSLRNLKIALVAALIFSGLSYYRDLKSVYWKDVALNRGMSAWLKGKGNPAYSGGNDIQILKKSIELGIYKPPTHLK